MTNSKQNDARKDGRQPLDLRPVRVTIGYTKYAEGSALGEIGPTPVLCTATVEEKVAQFLKNKGVGWITAEYSMLPRATESRTPREIGRGGPSGRTHEIQRMIGRSLRSVVDMAALGERSVTIDCDVIQADGGTRTASITGGFVAPPVALHKFNEGGTNPRAPLRHYITPLNLGVGGERRLLHLD